MKTRVFQAEKVSPPRGFVPFEWPKDFSQVDLEIGCGVGWHPIQYAAAHPDRFLIAIEKTREKFQKFAGRVARHSHPKNLYPVHADAVAWVTHALPPKSISRILIPYPNPNPKNAAHRWIRMPFFARLLETLRREGTVLFLTNLETYALEVKEHAVRDWGLRVLRDEKKTKADLAGKYRTHFEKKYLERGETCFEIELGF